MARRDHKRLRPILERWAWWCLDGAPVGPGRTMLAKLIENKGEIFFGGSGGSREPVDSIEAGIEAAVLTMALSDSLRADVLRLEFDAAWWRVCQRRGVDLEQYDPAVMGQFEKAHAIGISWATYKRRLTEALDIIEHHLGAK